MTVKSVSLAMSGSYCYYELASNYVCYELCKLYVPSATFIDAVIDDINNP
jgi:hypothetical protein